MALSLELLASILYFQGLSAAELELVVSFCFERGFSRNEVILLEGEPCPGVFFVASGSVKVTKSSPEGRELVLRIMRKGESFNEVPVFDGGPNPATVVALEPTVLFGIPTEKMAALILKNPRVAMNVLAIFAQRLRHLVSLAEDLTFRNVMARLARVLLDNLARGEEGPRLTQQDLAALAGTAREMVSRSLRSLEGMGAIKMEGRHIHILNPEVLRQLL